MNKLHIVCNCDMCRALNGLPPLLVAGVHNDCPSCYGPHPAEAETK